MLIFGLNAHLELLNLYKKEILKNIFNLMLLNFKCCS
jgi:hypothetical protein